MDQKAVDGGPVAVKIGCLGRARRFQRFDGAAWHFFQRFTEQFADETDGAAGDSSSTRQRAGAEDGDKEQRPDERVHGTAGDEQRLGKEVQPRLGVRLCAARMESGRAAIRAKMVPRVAMWKVSISAVCTATR